MNLQELLSGPPRYLANTPWRPLWAVAATLLILVGSQFLAAVPYSLLTGLTTDDLPARPLGSADEAAAEVVLLWLLLTQIAAIILTLLAAGVLGGHAREVLRLDVAGVGPRTLAYAVLLMALLLGSYNAVVYALRPSDVLDDMQLYVGFMKSDAWLLAGLAIGVGAPLMEELLFRGFLQSALARTRLGFWPAALLVTAGWTALHWGYSAVGLLEVLLIGLYFSWLLWRTGSLLPALFCHALYNSLLMTVLRFAPLPV